MATVLDPRWVTYIESLDYARERYEQRLKEAEEAVKEAERERDACKVQLAQIEGLRAYEQDRNGNQIRLEQGSPYRGMSLKEAAIQVIRDFGGKPVTFAMMIERLERYGYFADKDSPGRSLHAALMRAKGIEKVASATYRWPNGATS